MSHNLTIFSLALQKNEGVSRTCSPAPHRCVTIRWKAKASTRRLESRTAVSTPDKCPTESHVIRSSGPQRNRSGEDERSRRELLTFEMGESRGYSNNLESQKRFLRRVCPLLVQLLGEIRSVVLFFVVVSVVSLFPSPHSSQVLVFW